MFDKSQYFLSYLSIRIITFNYFVIKKIISDVLKEQKYNNILDFGCGVGILAPLFLSKQYLGFDVDAGSIAYAKGKYPKYSFKVGDATKLKLDKKFDLVVVVGVLHHLNGKEVRLALETMKLLLSPKGKVIIIEAIPPIYKWNLFGRVLRSLDKGHYVRTMKSYRQLMSGGLEVEKQYEKAGGLLDYGVFILNKVGKA